MKKVEAQVRKERLGDVDSALKKIGVPGLTIAEERVGGRGMWSYPMDNVKRLILTVVVDDSGVRKVVESIRGSASTRSWGDGRIVVSPVEEVFDIGSRTSEMSESLIPMMH